MGLRLIDPDASKEFTLKSDVKVVLRPLSAPDRLKLGACFRMRTDGALVAEPDNAIPIVVKGIVKFPEAPDTPIAEILDRLEDPFVLVDIINELIAYSGLNEDEAKN